MDPIAPNSLKGQLLIAMPELADPNFSRTVSCICEHSGEGAVGLVINRTHAFLTLKDILEELDIGYQPEIGAMPVHIGGPVHMDEVFLIHGPPFGWEGCLVITPALAMSNTRDILEAVAMGRGPGAFLITLGCAGWGPGQLESEIRQNSWLTCSVREDILFQTPVEEKWETSLKKIGIDPLLFSGAAGHA